jgi:hypothetical protein
VKSIPSVSYSVSVFLAGDVSEVKAVLRKVVMEVGLCVTVTPTTYLYAGGQEEGYVVGFVNYPRFPKSPDDIWGLAVDAARRLIKETCQWSALVQAPDRTLWLTDRPEEQSC